MKFVKEILKEGVFEVSTMDGPNRRTFTKDDLENIASTGRNMLRNGLRIPAPFEHSMEAKPEDDETSDKYENAGYWRDLYVKKNEEGRHSLFGVLDAPGNDAEPDTPAYKVSRLAKDTSICLLPKFRDGKGREWENALYHIALPQHPVEPGQSNFLPLPEDFSMISMSLEVRGVDMNKLLTLLSKCGLSLPEDTTERNILDRLMVAATQVSSGQSRNPLTSKPDGAKTETYPVMMSLTQKQVEAILGANLVDPETNEVFVQEVFRDVPSKEENYKKAAEMMGVQLNSIYKERYKDKISSLVSSGKISESYAQEALYPLVDAVQMSFKDGVPEKNHLDLTLQALEALPDLPTNTQTGRVSTAEFMSQKAPTSASKVENPLTNEGLVTDDEAAEIASAILKNTAGY